MRGGSDGWGGWGGGGWGGGGGSCWSVADTIEHQLMTQGSSHNLNSPVQEHTRVLTFLRVLVWCVFLFGRTPCAVFPALSVFINMAESNVRDPSLWFDDVVAARG